MTVRTSRVVVIVWLGYLSAIGCKPKDAAPADADAPADALADAAPDASATAVIGDAALTGETATRDVVKRWSDALDRHDVDALDALYAPRVSFYGRELAKNAVLDAKRRALGPKSTFHQSIVGDIAITKDPAGDVARFRKRSGATAMSEVDARLVIRDGRIREESDEASDRRAANPNDTCVAAAAAAVNALPAVKKLLADDEKALAKSKDGAALGGLGPLDDEGGGFSVSLGVHHADRYEAQVWYSVDGDGKLSTVTVRGEDIDVAPAAKQAVARACRKP